jgi:hypothetical protein
MPRRGLVALVVLVALCAGCAAGAGAFTGPPPQHASKVVYLDVEDRTTLPGPGGTAVWQHVLYGILPRYSTFYAAAGLGGALDQVLASISPTVVTVETGLTSLESGISPSVFAASLATLLGRLRSLRTGTILVANLIPANLARNVTTPSGAALSSGFLSEQIGRYDVAITATARRYGATIVNVNAVLSSAVARSGASSAFNDQAVRFGESSLTLTPYGWGLVEQAFNSALRGKSVAAGH